MSHKATPPPPNWLKCIHPGMRIHLGGGAACPIDLIEDFLAAVHHIGDLEFFQSLSLQNSHWAEERYSNNLKVNAVYLDPHLANMVNDGIADYSPCHYSDIPAMIQDGTIRIDAAFIMVSPPDSHGFCSLGPSIGWSPSAIDAARCVIAQINPKLPQTAGQSWIHESRINFSITKEHELPELPPYKSQHKEDPYERIGQYAAQLVNDGDTLQFGLGPVGNALANALHGHRHLGIHSEVFSDAMQKLFADGVIDNSRKTLVHGKIVTSNALGSRSLYAFIDQNPHFDFRPTDFVNNPITIARNDNMVSVNGALMADITGQIVLDSLSGLFRSGVGSMVDFVLGAAMSRGGRPIIALPSTRFAEDGSRVSNVVAQLPAGAGVACQRSDIFYIITEFGIATLRGRTIQDRIKEMIQIAHPDFREELLKDARNHHLLPSYFSIPPVQLEALNTTQAQRLHLKDKKVYLLRPLNPADDLRLQEFFYSHTEETIVRRYGFTVTRMSRQRAFELVGINQNTDLGLAIIEMLGPRQVIQAVGRYYLDPDGKSAEMAFVVAESKRRLGMARVLLTRMIEVATQRRLHKLWAQVDHDNTPMLKLFRKCNSVEAPGEDPHTICIEINLASQLSSQDSKKPGRFIPFR